VAEAITVLPILGSLRDGSFNRMLANAARELAPTGVSVLAEPDLRPIPPYDDDVRLADGFPEAVVALREAVREADAVLFVSPEYNYSLPGFLKNAIDWASRGEDQPFRHKPVGIMGASRGQVGTARMQYHLRQILIFLDAYAVTRPEVMLGFSPERFDEQGKLVDEAARGFVRQHLEALHDWTLRLRA
jgi:chromate reductase